MFASHCLQLNSFIRSPKRKLGLRLPSYFSSSRQIEEQVMYLSNPHLYEARTNLISVVAVSPEESKECKVPSDVINLVTDKITLEDSLFHPQGGGQPSDKGTLVDDNNEIFNVLFVSSSSKSGVKVTEHYGCFQSSTAVDAESNITASLEQINLQSSKASIMFRYFYT